METQWYLRNGNFESGPFSTSQLKQLAQQGRIGEDSHVRRQEDRTWTPAIQVKGLLALRSKAAAQADAPLAIPLVTTAVRDASAVVAPPALGKPISDGADEQMESGQGRLGISALLLGAAGAAAIAATSMAVCMVLLAVGGFFQSDPAGQPALNVFRSSPASQQPTDEPQRVALEQLRNDLQSQRADQATLREELQRHRAELSQHQAKLATVTAALEKQKQERQTAQDRANRLAEQPAQQAALPAGAAGTHSPEGTPPTEAEMREAFEDFVAALNNNLAEQASAAKNRTYNRNDPYEVLQALGGAIVGDGRFVVISFTKLGATRAVGEPGFNCAFSARLTIEGDGFFARTQGPFLEKYSGEIVRARFYRHQGKWIFQPGNG